MNNTTKWILIAAAVVVLGVVAVVGGVAGLGYYGWNVFMGEVQATVDANPVVQEHLGVVQEVETDFARTGEEPDPDTFAFRVRGVRGSGTVVAAFQSTPQGEVMTVGRLELADGRVFDLESGEPVDGGP